MKKAYISGFWFAYIETLTGLAAIFLILFLASSYRESLLTKDVERIIRAWQEAEKKLNELGVAPVPDMEMGGMRITLADSVVFPLNSAFLSYQGKRKIVDISNVLIKFCKSNPNIMAQMRIKVGGHTDLLGGDDINFPLSYYRARNVSEIIQDAFSKSGINEIRITPIAYGSKYPLKNHYRIVEPQNRRITIVLELLSNILLSKDNN